MGLGLGGGMHPVGTSATHGTDGFAGRGVTQVVVDTGLLGDGKVTHHLDGLGESGGAGQPQLRAAPPLINDTATNQGVVLGMRSDRQVQPGGGSHRVIHDAGTLHPLAVVGEPDGAGTRLGVEVHELLTGQPGSDR